MYGDYSKYNTNKIVIHSDNDPLRPEFPPQNPKFPATPTYHIDIPGFDNVWLKDESYNPTGTHKDRMAWEIVVSYRDIIMSYLKNGNDSPLPQFSLISSGSAAYAIQKVLSEYNLPNIKILIDFKVPESVVTFFESIGCEVYKTDFSLRKLETDDILRLTNNTDGFDITSLDALDPGTRFYDRLSYEIINHSPDYCFIPFGTGTLYENIMSINKKEITSSKHDPRFSGDINVLRGCNFIGVTSSSPYTKAQKLYSPYLPFTHISPSWIRFYKSAGYCGQGSGIFHLDEKCLDEAMSIADSLHIVSEPSGIAGLAMMLQMKEQIPRDSKVLIVNTGRSKYIDLI